MSDPYDREPLNRPPRDDQSTAWIAVAFGVLLAIGAIFYFSDWDRGTRTAQNTTTEQPAPAPIQPAPTQPAPQ